MRRIAIVGAREHPDLRVVSEYVRELAELRDRGEDILIISGGAEGVDQIAVEDAKKLRLKVRVYESTIHPTFPFLMELSNRDALLYRNTLIAIDCTEMTLFPDGSKGGCWDAAREAKRFGRPVEIRLMDGKIYEYHHSGGKKLKGNWRQGGLFT